MLVIYYIYPRGQINDDDDGERETHTPHTRGTDFRGREGRKGKEDWEGVFMYSFDHIGFVYRGWLIDALLSKFFFVNY